MVGIDRKKAYNQMVNPNLGGGKIFFCWLFQNKSKTQREKETDRDINICIEIDR